MDTVLKAVNVSSHLEKYFRIHGQFCARKAKLVIGISILVSVICGIGIIRFRWENHAIRLWISQESDFVRDHDYLWQNFPPEWRFHQLLFVAQDNILQPRYFHKMYETYKRWRQVQVRDKSWDKMCYRVPVLKVDLSTFISDSRRRRDINEDDDDLLFGGSGSDFFSADDFKFQDFDPSISFYPRPYCSVVNAMPSRCLEHSLLELWARNGHFDLKSEEALDSLNTEDLLQRLNSQNVSGLYLMERNFSKLLGGVTRNPVTGELVSAHAIQMLFVGKMNATAAMLNPIGIGNALGEWVDQDTLDFEADLIRTFVSDKTEPEDGLQLFTSFSRSMNDIASSSTVGDMKLVVVGFGLCFIYVLTILGKYDRVENRALLSLMGLSSIGLAMFATLGITSLMQLAYSPLHNFIPFLFLGLGIDDMFVIVESYNNHSRALRGSEKRQKRSIPEDIGEALATSGVSITVTSLTDVMAFSVGAFTKLPALRSFSLFCAIGIFFIYVLQCTWFVAWLAIDLKRMEERRNGCLPCVRHSEKKAKPKAESQESSCPRPSMRRGFATYGAWLVRTPIKMVVVLLTMLFLGISVWGNMLLKQEFDPMWFLPHDSYLALYNAENAK